MLRFYATFHFAQNDSKFDNCWHLEVEFWAFILRSFIDRFHHHQVVRRPLPKPILMLV